MMMNDGNGCCRCGYKWLFFFCICNRCCEKLNWVETCQVKRSLVFFSQHVASVKCCNKMGIGGGFPHPTLKKICSFVK